MSDQPSSSPPFIISREFEAPRDVLWKAWTDPEEMKQWLGPKGVTSSPGAQDLRPGGLYHYCMRTPDGHEMWGKYLYREVTEPEKLVFIHSFSDANCGTTRHPMSATWPLEWLSTITFTERDHKTTVTIRWETLLSTPDEERQTFDAAHDGMTQGWTGSLDQLTAYITEIQTKA